MPALWWKDQFPSGVKTGADLRGANIPSLKLYISMGGQQSWYLAVYRNIFDRETHIIGPKFKNFPNQKKKANKFS